MAEWEDVKGDESCFITTVGGHRLKVWYGRIDHTWRMNYPPVSPTCGVVVRLKSDEPEAAKLEALHIVGEWAKQVAVEAAELRGRMVGAELNAKGAGHDG